MAFVNSFSHSAAIVALSVASLSLSGLTGCVGSEEPLDLAEASFDVAEEASAVVVRRTDWPATTGLRFIADDIGGSDGTLCFTDPATGGLRCVATIEAAPSLYHAGDIVYADAQPQSCAVGPTGALSGCYDLDISPGDGSTEMVSCGELSGEIICFCTTKAHCDGMKAALCGDGKPHNCNGDGTACTCSAEDV